MAIPINFNGKPIKIKSRRLKTIKSLFKIQSLTMKNHRHEIKNQSHGIIKKGPRLKFK